MKKCPSSFGTSGSSLGISWPCAKGRSAKFPKKYALQMEVGKPIENKAAWTKRFKTFLFLEKSRSLRLPRLEDVESVYSSRNEAQGGESKIESVVARNSQAGFHLTRTCFFLWRTISQTCCFSGTVVLADLLGGIRQALDSQKQKKSSIGLMFRVWF